MSSGKAINTINRFGTARRLQFGVMASLAIVGVLCAILSLWVNSAHRQRRIVQSLQEKRIYVSYSVDHDADGMAYDATGKMRPVSWIPHRLVSILGSDFFYSARSVSMTTSEFAWKTEGSDFRIVGELHDLRALSLNASMFTDTDFEVIHKLKRLRYLSLCDTEITDAAIDELAQLKNLKTLNLSYTALSPDAVARLRKHLPNTELLWCQRPTRPEITIRVHPLGNPDVRAADRNIESTTSSEVGQRDPITANSVSVEQTSSSDRDAAVVRGASETGMVLVPAGTLVTPVLEGYDYSEPRVFDVDAFYIDRFEVTNRQYKAFIDATQRHPPDTWQYYTNNPRFYPEGTDDLPVWEVSWDDANGYATWCGKRLPTDVEWQWAAVGDQNTKYPWGDVEDLSRCNVNVKHPPKTPSYQLLAPVTSYPNGAGPFGTHHMIGNAWEWTSTPDGQGGHFIRGGSSFTPLYPVTYRESAGFPGDDVGRTALGFRCAKSAHEGKRKVARKNP